MTTSENWKTKMLVSGAVVGAVTGVAAIYIFIRNAEARSEQPDLGTGEGIKLGLGLLSFLRLVSDIGK